MSPDQISLAGLRIQEFQLAITTLAIVLGPLIGVIFTLWFQARKDRRDAKLQLFLTLVAERKTSVSPQFVQALNKIDAVFSDSLVVRKAWHDYYALLHGVPTEARIHQWLELLTAMAEELGYKNIRQVDLDKFYLPQGHVDDAEFQRKVAQQWARVLENTERFLVEMRERDGAPDA